LATLQDLVQLVEAARQDVRSTSALYARLQPPGWVPHPIAFFGDPRRAVVATVGVNPSIGEFLPGRRWPLALSAEDLTHRLVGYFDSMEPPPHPWFHAWEDALGVLGQSYRQGACHFDLSPRATRSLGSLDNGDAALFHRMLTGDIRHWCRLLSVCPNIRLLLAAGAISKKTYVIEFLRGLSCVQDVSVRMQHEFRRQPGVKGGVGLYVFTLGGVDRMLFFCGSSPSDRRNPGLLGTRIAEHAETLRRWL